MTYWTRKSTATLAMFLISSIAFVSCANPQFDHRKSTDIHVYRPLNVGQIVVGNRHYAALTYETKIPQDDEKDLHRQALFIWNKYFRAAASEHGFNYAVLKATSPSVLGFSQAQSFVFYKVASGWHEVQ